MDEYKEGLYRTLMRADFQPMEGAKELIIKLQASGFKIAVGSSGPKDNVLVAIEGLGLDDIIPLHKRVSGSDVKKGKPDPEVFLKAAESLGLPPSRCVVIEDAPVGLQAARAAGTKCIGLASTGRTRQELSLADLVVDSLHELSPVILQRLIDDK
jgi:beta-phosphoglucomutase